MLSAMSVAMSAVRARGSSLLALALAVLACLGCGSCSRPDPPGGDAPRPASPAPSGADLDDGRAPSTADVVVYYAWADRCAEVVLDKFALEHGVTVRGMRRSGRHIVKLIEAERAQPVASVVMSGPAPSYEMLKAAGLLRPYRPAGAEAVPSEFRDPQGMWTGIYLGLIAFGWDSRRVAEPPRSYAELLRAPLDRGVTYANPATSGTAYTFLLGLVSVYGEKGAFDYLDRLHPRVSEVPSGGAMAVQLVNLGEASVGIAFAHDILAAQQRNPALRLSFPEEGAGWEVGGAALLAGAPNAELGRRFLDFLLVPAVQETFWREAGLPVYPTHPDAAPPPGAPPFRDVKRVRVDIVEAGRKWDERAREFNRRFSRRR